MAGRPARWPASEAGSRRDPSWSPDPLPGRGRAVARRAGVAARPRRTVVRTVGRTVQTVRSLSDRNREVAGTLPPSPVRGPRTSINRAISPHRRVAFAELPARRRAADPGGARGHGQRRGAGGHGGGHAHVLRRAGRGARRLAGGHGAGVGAGRTRTGCPGQPGVGHAGVAGRRGGGPGGPPAVTSGTGWRRPRSRAGRSGRRCSPGGPRPPSRRWPPGCRGW